MKCEYVGCKNEARYKTVARIKGHQTLFQCESCAPDWVRNKQGNPAIPNLWEITDLKTGEVVIR